MIMMLSYRNLDKRGPRLRVRLMTVKRTGVKGGSVDRGTTRLVCVGSVCGCRETADTGRSGTVYWTDTFIHADHHRTYWVRGLFTPHRVPDAWSNRHRRGNSRKA